MKFILYKSIIERFEYNPSYIIKVQMSGEISEQEIMFKLVRIFVAQYLSSVRKCL